MKAVSYEGRLILANWLFNTLGCITLHENLPTWSQSCFKDEPTKKTLANHDNQISNLRPRSLIVFCQIWPTSTLLILSVSCPRTHEWKLCATLERNFRSRKVRQPSSLGVAQEHIRKSDVLPDTVEQNFEKVRQPLEKTPRLLRTAVKTKNRTYAKNSKCEGVERVNIGNIGPRGDKQILVIWNCSVICLSPLAEHSLNKTEAR